MIAYFFATEKKITRYCQAEAHLPWLTHSTDKLEGRSLHACAWALYLCSNLFAHKKNKTARMKHFPDSQTQQRTQRGLCTLALGPCMLAHFSTKKAKKNNKQTNSILSGWSTSSLTNTLKWTSKRATRRWHIKYAYYLVNKYITRHCQAEAHLPWLTHSSELRATRRWHIK